MKEATNTLSISNWECAPRTPALQDEIVHIWCASLDLPPKDISQNHTLLSADEKRRAENFFFIKDRNGFIAARGILRNILSRYLTVDPAAITFSYSPSGKPFLTDSSNHEGLSFNLSHSHRMALYAVTLSRGVGVDLEHIRQDFEWNDIARIFLSPEEMSHLQKTPKNIRFKKFYTYWSRKEAFLKSIGTGLTIDPKNITVLRQSGLSGWIMLTNTFTGPHRQWSLLDLNLGPDYAASLAVEGKGAGLQYWKW
jgi:4'-phosphopantetheinyl transferase